MVAALILFPGNLLFANPEVRPSPRIEPFDDCGFSNLDTLMSQSGSSGRPRRHIYIEDRAFRQSGLNHIEHEVCGKGGRIAEVKITPRGKTECDPRQSEDRCLERTCNSSRIGYIIAQIRPVIDARNNYVRKPAFKYLCHRKRYAVSWSSIN